MTPELQEAFQQFDYFVGIARHAGLGVQAAEDCASEAFERALLSWDPARGPARPYVAQIAHNLAVDTLRRAHVATDPLEALNGDGEPYAYQIADDSPPIEAALLDADQRPRVRAKVRRVLGLLQPRHRRALEVVYLDGHGLDGAAERLGCPVGTVKSRASRAAAAFREAWLRPVGRPRLEVA